MVRIDFKGIEDPQTLIKGNIAYAKKLANSRQKKQKVCGTFTPKSMRFIATNYGLTLRDFQRAGHGYFKCTYVVEPDK